METPFYTSIPLKYFRTKRLCCFAVQVAIHKYFHPWIFGRKCCITVVKMDIECDVLTCSTVVVFVACLGTNMHLFSIRLPNTPNAMNNILFYCCLCVTSGYKYDRVLLHISLAFSTLVWRLHKCRYSSWTGKRCLKDTWLHQGSVVCELRKQNDTTTLGLGLAWWCTL